VTRRRRVRTGLAAAVLVLAGCTGTSATGDPPGPPARAAEWQADLDGLLPALRAVHPDLAGGVPPALTAAVAELRAGAPHLDDDQLMVGVMRIMASVAPGGDGHTGLYVWSPGNRPVHSLPLRWWSFPEGLVVEDVLDGDRSLVGAEVRSIGGTPLAEVERRVDRLVAHETSSTPALLRPRFLLIPEVLHGLGLVTDPAAPVRLELATPAGRRRTVDVRPVPMERYDAWAGSYGLGLVPRPGLRFLADPDAALRHEPVQQRQTLYVGFGRVEPLDAAELAAVAAAARDRAVRRVVVDVRTNIGGEVGAGRPLLEALTAPAVLSHARLYVLTSRTTFSAAALFVAELRAAAPVVVVGEPASSGAPSYGNARDVRLPRTGLVLSVASTREGVHGAEGAKGPNGTSGVAVDLPVAMRSADWLAGRDAVLLAALADRR
jgi:hypothetical protein